MVSFIRIDESNNKNKPEETNKKQKQKKKNSNNFLYFKTDICSLFLYFSLH